MRKDGSRADQQARNGCEPGADPNTSAFTDLGQLPRVLDSNTAIAFVAVNIDGRSERELDCTCFQLTFTDGPARGKKLIVQNTNTGVDLAAKHFDILIAGTYVRSAMSASSIRVIQTRQ